jgi:hypothetical protein
LSRGIVVFRDYVFNQREEKVMEIDKTTLMRRRESAG